MPLEGLRCPSGRPGPGTVRPGGSRLESRWLPEGPLPCSLSLAFQQPASRWEEAGDSGREGAQQPQGPRCLSAPLCPALGFACVLCKAQDLAGRAEPGLRPRYPTRTASVFRVAGGAALQRVARLLQRCCPGPCSARHSPRRHAGLPVSRARTGGPPPTAWKLLLRGAGQHMAPQGSSTLERVPTGPVHPGS